MSDRPILGIDPGISGAIALLYDDHVHASDIPVVDGEIDVSALVFILRNARPRIAIIERVSAMPKQGVSSTFRFGQSYGAVRAAVAACGIPCHLVTPSKWKRSYGLGSDKEASRGLAVRLWPKAECFRRKKDHGRAEAALLAKYGAEVIETKAVA